MGDKTPNDAVVMLACYQVEESEFDQFMGALRDTEDLYRKFGVVTSAPCIRLRSVENPEYIVELIEWLSPEHLQSVMENNEIMNMWGEIKALWKSGDFGMDKVPEAHVPWAVMRPIQNVSDRD